MQLKLYCVFLGFLVSTWDDFVDSTISLLVFLECHGVQFVGYENTRHASQKLCIIILAFLQKITLLKD